VGSSVLKLELIPFYFFPLDFRFQAVNLWAVGSERIQAVSCGAQHSLLLTDRGRLLSWGRSLEGQCGQGARTATSAPQPVSGLDKVG
jgi:alpha-tubulin suppressor-like RCC1 family protein